MPDSDDFVKGFDFFKGDSYDGYLLESINASHSVIKKYKEYSYHIILTYDTKHKDVNDEEFFNYHVFEDKIINSRYGNPYKCSLIKKNFSINGTKLTIELEGHSYRVHK